MKIEEVYSTMHKLVCRFEKQLVVSIVMSMLLSPLAFAHNGDDGTSALAGSALGSQTVLKQGHVDHETTATESFWGNIILAIAYQRDPILKKYTKKVHRAGDVTLLAIMGISSLSLAQSIIGLNNAGPDFIEHEESKTTATMGVVNSGATLATLGIKTWVDHHYLKKIEKRQEELQEETSQILDHLKADKPFSEVEGRLQTLMGKTATGEFKQLWLKVYQQDHVAEKSAPAIIE